MNKKRRGCGIALLVGLFLFYGLVSNRMPEKAESVLPTEATEELGAVKENALKEETTEDVAENPLVAMDAVPAYSGKAAVEVNGNVPLFSEEEKANTTAFETYSALDGKKRVGVAYANICTELMPAGERGAIGMIKPTGWHTTKYPEYIKGLYLYNRCHLIAWSLAGENSNNKNLMTGTRFFNVNMIPFEDAIHDYVKASNNHVLYRVTPVFQGDELVARYAILEAYSVEDQGAGVQFCVAIYNVQPHIGIDYATGESWVDAAVPEADSVCISTGKGSANVSGIPTSGSGYVVNANNGKVHRESCKRGPQEQNRIYYGSLEEVKTAGYGDGCKWCNPFN